jgi:cell division protein ZapA
VNDSQPGVVHVKIYDADYTLRTTGDADRLRNLCAELDRLMRTISKETGSVDTVKVAILSALSLAEELRRAKDQLRQMDEALSKRSLECVSMLDRFLH